MADLPKSVRVGYRDFTVEAWAPNHANASGRFGECDKMNAIIRVDASYGPTKAANTLLHEVIHCAFEQGGIDDADPEEKTVTILGNVLTQVWRDNPEFVAFMSASLAN